jgi:hypothetical protein
MTAPAAAVTPAVIVKSGRGERMVTPGIMPLTGEPARLRA